MAQTAAIDLSKPTAAGPAAAGLTTSEAEQRRTVYGANAIAEAAPRRWRSFLAKFWSPVAWMLEAAIVLQLWLGQTIEAGLIGGLLLFNATLGFVQEGRAGVALAALKKRLAPTALVRRDGEWTRLTASGLVPGDLIRLPLGAVVPADATVVSGSVMLDQSTLTGESVPVEAEPGARLFAGSMVRRGQAIAEVTATGDKTYFGRTAELVRVAHVVSTEQAAIFAVTRNLAIINGVVAALIIASAYWAALPAADQVRLALTALLATIPLALPATFTLSAALSARILAQRGVLLTRLTAAHEAAAMDILCADKTGTLTVNTLKVADAVAMPSYTPERLLALAALASSEADQDPIDAAIHVAAKDVGASDRLLHFVPFDPASKRAEAVAVDRDGHEIHVVKGAFEVIAQLAPPPSDAEQRVHALAERGHRVIAVAAGAPSELRFCGLIALSDPPREDSKELVATLRDMNVRTVMVTGDSAATAATIAGQVGIAGAVCSAERMAEDTEACGVFARVTPEQKYELVKTLQHDAHVVGMCGDGVNDAPALRQAQVGVAVATATDVAKAAAAMVLTEPGLAGVVAAVREGRVGFQRLLAFVFNMLVKKTEIVLFLAIGLALTGHGVLTPALMVLLFVTNDFLAMSLTTDRASPALRPSVWRMRNITAAAVVLGACKLAFSVSVLAVGRFRVGFNVGELQTLAFATLAFGNQAALYVLREQRHMFSSKPSNWIMASSVVDIVIVGALALTGTLMAPLSWRVLAAVLVATAGFALILDRIKLPVTALFKLE
jgi:H+-transporting ATPase